jgi:integrase/recombinase XerD
MRRRPTRIVHKARKGTTGALLGPVLQRYFCSYLIDQRQISPRTITAYRDTFRLLLTFIERSRRCKLELLRVQDLDVGCILAFLDHIERNRHNCARTRNARLAAIRSFLRYAAGCEPLLLPIAQTVLSIPTKRFERRTGKYLTRQQMQLLLKSASSSTLSGQRDRALLMLMYNTGARVSEVAGLKVGDLQIETGGSIHLRGKGRKQRTLPLWRESLRLLRTWIRATKGSSDAPLFPNARGGHMTRSGIEQRLRVIVSNAAAKDLTFQRLRISPHTVRRTTAMHLLQSGVDLSVIAMWLGHESIQTTHQYLDADLKTKQLALDHLHAPVARRTKARRVSPLIEFLTRL